MKLVTSSRIPYLQFVEGQEASQKVIISGDKIAWLHSQADKAGALFDITLKDGHGGIKFQQKNCGGQTEKFGKLINIPTLVGEVVEVFVENIRGAKKVDVFVN